MKLETESRALTFDSVEELSEFHGQLSILLREVTMAAAGSSTDAEIATSRAREVLERFDLITSGLNALRGSGLITRKGE